MNRPRLMSALASFNRRLIAEELDAIERELRRRGAMPPDPIAEELDATERELRRRRAAMPKPTPPVACTCSTLYEQLRCERTCHLKRR